MSLFEQKNEETSLKVFSVHIFDPRRFEPWVLSQVTLVIVPTSLGPLHVTASFRPTIISLTHGSLTVYRQNKILLWNETIQCGTASIIPSGLSIHIE
jgi:F0F1-type ATP synthase epsilon subunit